MDDRSIVELFLERSESAIIEAEEKYGRLCRSIARGVLGNEEDAEECVNDAYLAAWNSIPPKEPERLSAYLGRLTRNIALDRYDMKRAEKRGGGEVTAALDELYECVLPDIDITDELALRDALTHFLRQQPERARRIFVRRYWYMQTVHEIASACGYSESLVKMTLKRTRDKLKLYFEKEGIMI